MDGKGRHRNCSGKGEHPLPQRLISSLIKEPSGPDAQHDRGGDSPMHRGNEFGSLTFPEIGEADRNDQEGFEPFAKGDDKRLQHMVSFR